MEMVSKPKEKGVKALARTLTKRENTLRVTQSVEEAEIMSGKMFVPSVTLYFKINQFKIQERSSSPSTTLTSTPTVEAKWDNGTRTTWFVSRRRRPDVTQFSRCCPTCWRTSPTREVGRRGCHGGARTTTTGRLG